MPDLIKHVKKFLLIPLLCLFVMTAGACGAADGKNEQKSDSSMSGLTLLDQEDEREAEGTDSGGTLEYGGAGADETRDYEEADDTHESAGSGEAQAYEDAGSEEDEIQQEKGTGGKDSPEDAEKLPDENGTYTTKEDVALFLHVYGRLPDNFMTKKQARTLGWSGGSLERYAPGMCIGGDRFGNYEDILPEGNYHECDINTLGKSKRGAERLVYSDDGRIYYTNDHYETFTLLYGEEKSPAD